MTISEKAWSKYIRALSSINDTAAKKFTAYVSGLDFGQIDSKRKAINYAVQLAVAYGESAAAVSCEMYDAIVAAAGLYYPAAEPAVLADNIYQEVAKTVNGMIKQNASAESMGSAVGRLVKRQGVDTTMKNAIRDGAEWAWIPSGDTCAFCIALASRGWQRASKKALKNGHAEHIHANCDCTYAIRFDERTTVRGYDPDKYLKMYEDADGSSPAAKINSMRREFYAENSERINAQKRDAYAKRQERESSDAEELHV